MQRENKIVNEGKEEGGQRMKKLDLYAESKVIEKLEKAIQADPDSADDLNRAAIKRIYESEKCSCGALVSMLSMLSPDGLCGACDWWRMHP